MRISPPGTGRAARAAAGRAAIAALVALALVACSGPVDCKPCGSGLSLDPAGLVTDGGPTVTGYRVCLDGSCQELPPLRSYDTPAEGYTPSISLRVDVADRTFATVTVAALAGTEILAEVAGRDLVVPKDTDQGVCDCDYATLKLDASGATLVIVAA